jgi:hypothetical protein
MEIIRSRSMLETSTPPQRKKHHILLRSIDLSHQATGVGDEFQKKNVKDGSLPDIS